MLPTITIVTPSYNQGRFLDEAICSVLSQDYPRLQYMVIDGGSADSSCDVIRRYAGKLDFWVSEKDRGQSDALRKGFSRATGELLGWLNSDDILLPGALRRVSEAYEANPGCIVAGNVKVFSDRQPVKSRVIRQRFLNVRDMTAIWSGAATYSQPGAFFPRAAYVAAGGVDETLHQCMDHDLMIRMLQKCGVVYVDQTIAAARVHPQSKTFSQAGAQIVEAYRVSRRYWNELPHSEMACRFLSLLGLGRCALGRLYHRNPAALRPVLAEMMNVATGRSR